MTKVLLVLTVLAMVALTGLAIYDAYRSIQPSQSEAEDAGLEEVPSFEVPGSF